MVMPCSRSARRPSVTKVEVDLADSPAGRGRRHRLDLVVEELAGVVEEPPDKGGLAVVDRADGGEAEQSMPRGPGPVGRGREPGPVTLEVPLPLRSSIEVSEKRSSARVAPRSETREAAHLGDDLVHRGGAGPDRPGAGGVADGPVAHGLFGRRLAGARGRPTRRRAASRRARPPAARWAK